MFKRQNRVLMQHSGDTVLWILGTDGDLQEQHFWQVLAPLKCDQGGGHSPSGYPLHVSFALYGKPLFDVF